MLLQEYKVYQIHEKTGISKKTIYDIRNKKLYKNLTKELTFKKV